MSICHVVPSQRKDGKSIVVSKLRLQKYKHVILGVKKQKCKVKLRGNEIFINEHLSPDNRRLFSNTSQRKCELAYKFLWTKNGNIHLRKNESSSVHTVTCYEDLVALCVVINYFVQTCTASRLQEWCLLVLVDF